MAAPTLLACTAEQSAQIFQPAGQVALLRVINASTPVLNVLVDGVTVAGPFQYGDASNCLTVNSREPKLAAKWGAVTSVFQGTFADGEQAYLVAAAWGSGAGAVYWTVRVPRDTVTGTPARLRVMNISGAGPYDAYLTPPNSPLGTPSATAIATGDVVAPFDIAPGEWNVRLTDAGTQTVALDLGNRQFEGSKREMLVIAPPDTGSSAIRTFFWSASCP